MLKRREEVKFVLVGGFCYLVTTAIYYTLKLTILERKPVTALIIATVIASVVSYLLNREWSFRTRGGRRRHHEASLFFLFSAVAVGLTAAPQYVSRYFLHLQTPYVSRPVQELADFVSGLIIGTLLGMVFRLWAFRRWVFPHENVRPGRRERVLAAAASAADHGGAGQPSINGHANGHNIVTGSVPIAKAQPPAPAQERAGPPA
jgi:putative flippase GtrA